MYYAATSPFLLYPRQPTPDPDKNSVPARPGKRVWISNEKRCAWRRAKSQRQLTYPEIADALEKIETVDGRPTRQTLRNLLNGPTQASPLTPAMDVVLGTEGVGEQEDDASPSETTQTTQASAATFQRSIMEAFDRAVELGAEPSAVAAAAIEAIAQDVEHQLVSRIRSLIPGSPRK